MVILNHHKRFMQIIFCGALAFGIFEIYFYCVGSGNYIILAGK